MLLLDHTQSENLFRACTACPDTKIKILNHGPRVANGLDTDHGLLSVGPDLGRNCLKMLTVDKSRLDN